MQPDFMKMAQQGQAAPKEQPQAEQAPQGDGLTVQGGREGVKQRLMSAFEQLGYMETLKTPAQQQEFAMQLDQLVELLVAKKFKEIQAHPLMKKMNELIPQQKQQAAPQAGPTDFASMMPPGGGMSGR
jgi:hypothetical protein